MREVRIVKMVVWLGENEMTGIFVFFGGEFFQEQDHHLHISQFHLKKDF